MTVRVSCSACLCSADSDATHKAARRLLENCPMTCGASPHCEPFEDPAYQKQLEDKAYVERQDRATCAD